MKTLLVDNGSLEPAATLALREAAAKLSEEIGQSVEPVSLLHSHKVSPDELGGIPAEIVETFLRREATAGESEFTVVPLFIGPSRAITIYLPELVERLRADYPKIAVKIAPPLYQEGDLRLAKLLADRVRDVLDTDSAKNALKRVALVDHGSPVASVTAVRDALAKQLVHELSGEIETVAACSMERRPGPEYDFNEPLLETLLSRAEWRTSPVIVAQLFLVPGRHAGPNGDVAAICTRAEAASSGLRTFRTQVLAPHPGLIEILADRWRSIGREV